MVINTVDEDNEYEAQRAANIAKNQALLRELQLNAASAGLAVFTGAAAGNGSRSSPATRTTTRAQRSKAKATAAAGSKRKSRGGDGDDNDDNNDDDDDDDDDDASNAVGASRRKRMERLKKQKKEQLEAAAAPRRTSSRLAGLPADSELARQKAAAEQAALEAAARVKQQRVSADLELGDIVVAGRKWDGWIGSSGSSFLGDAATAHGNHASQNGTTQNGASGSGGGDNDRKKKPEDAAFKALRRRMGALKLYETFEPNSKPFRHPSPYLLLDVSA